MSGRGGRAVTMGSRSAVWVVLVGLTLILGFHSLDDLDLGWHLAGGLRIVEAGAIPTTDPFTIGAVPWINYSWLPELCYAAAYRIGGFEWLRLVQWLLVVACTFSIYALGCCRREGRQCDIGALFALVCVLPLLAPFLHLRPQLLSVALFAVALLLLERRTLTFPFAALLTVFWAACHIYWVFVPALWVLYRATERDQRGRALVEAVLLFFAGAISPYGIENLRPVFEYALKHEVGYLLIDEFQPLIRVPFAAVWFAASLVFMFVFWRGERDGRLKLLLFVFALGSIAQRKYLPLYAVVWVALASERLAARLRERTREDEGATPLLCALAFCVAALCSVPRTPALAPRFGELLQLMHSPPVVQALSADPDPRVFNHFDDGGWLALASTLSSPRFLTSIDGRTLVAGPVRLAEFHRLLTGSDGERCEIFERTSATVGVVPLRSNAFRALFSDERQCIRAAEWGVIARGEFYEIWGRSPQPRGER